MSTRRLILASASPRRRELLEQIGCAFEVMPAVGEENAAADTPAGLVRKLAEMKAQEVAGRLKAQGISEELLVLGSDTVVACDGKVLGKPADDDEARRMLRLISGRAHTVRTGAAGIFLPEGRAISFSEETKVFVAPLSDGDIEAYIATGEHRDKAGSYGVQGVFARHIERIEGDYFTVVGLPLSRVWREIINAGTE